MGNLSPQKLYQLDTEVSMLVQKQAELFLELGRRLYEIEVENYYADLDYETFESYLADKGLNYKTARAYINVYKIFIDQLEYKPQELADIPWSKLQAIVPVVKTVERVEADEWLDKARTLSMSDLAIEKREDQANVGFEKRKPYPILYRCSDCGKWKLPSDLEVCTKHNG